MPLLSLFTLPTPTEFLASTSEYSAPVVTDFMPFIILILGITIGLGVVVLLIGVFLNRGK